MQLVGRGGVCMEYTPIPILKWIQQDFTKIFCSYIIFIFKIRFPNYPNPSASQGLLPWPPIRAYTGPAGSLKQPPDSSPLFCGPPTAIPGYRPFFRGRGGVIRQLSVHDAC